MSAGEAVVRGGAEYDGRAAAALDEDEIARFLGEVWRHGEAVAITSVFSPVAPDQELAAAELVRRELGTARHVSLSHEIGSVGLLERENATVLNGALVGTVEAFATAFEEALERTASTPRPSRPERRHADGAGARPPLPGAHHRQRRRAACAARHT